MGFFNAHVFLSQILIDIVFLNRTCNYCLSAKHTQSRNVCSRAKYNRQYFHLRYHCILCAALARLHVRRKQEFCVINIHWNLDLNFPCSNLTVDKFICKRLKLYNNFYFLKHTKYSLKYCVLKGLFSRPGIFNNTSRIPKLKTHILFVSVWIQLLNEYNRKLK